MPTPDNPLADDFPPVPPQCRATVDAIQAVLDGDAGPEALAADAHPLTCAACRERVRAARVLLAMLAAPAEAVEVPAGFADRVLIAALADAWNAPPQPPGRARRAVRLAGLVGLAAAVLLAVFVIAPRWERERRRPNDTFAGVQIAPAAPAARPAAAPAPREKAPAPTPRPVRIGDEVAKAGQSLRDFPKPVTDSVAVGPKLLDAFAGAFRAPAGPMPVGEALEPARRSLAELPDAARAGLEPVTGTAQKALDRLLRDVAAVKPKS